ncbi:MAG: LuxR C-terminal-related transcriptional regulator [Paracoccaceae bacterium]
MYHAQGNSEGLAEIALAGAIAAIGTADFIPRALDYLRAVAPFPGCFLTLLNGNRPPLHLYDNVRAERRAQVIDRYLDGAYLLDPFYVAYRAMNPCAQPCAFLHLRDVAPDRFSQSTYSREYYNSIRLEDEAAFLIDLPSGKHLFYSIGRLDGQPKFSTRDVRAFRRALPIFAAMNRRHFADDNYAGPTTGVQAGNEIDLALHRFGAGTLTDREREIAILVLKGHSSKSIANATDIAPGTVKIHRKNIYRKLKISSQSELFAMFLNALTHRGAAPSGAIPEGIYTNGIARS